MYSSSSSRSRSSSLSSRSSSRSRRLRLTQLARDQARGSPPPSRRSSRAPPIPPILDTTSSAQQDDSRPSTRSSLPPDALTTSWQMFTPDGASHPSSGPARSHGWDDLESPLRAAGVDNHIGSWTSPQRGQSSPIDIKHHLHDFGTMATPSPLARPVDMARTDSRSSPMPIPRLSTDQHDLRSVIFGEALKPSRPPSKSTPSPLASYGKQNITSYAGPSSEAPQLSSWKPALPIRTATEHQANSSAQVDAWCSDQLAATTSSLTERQQNVSGALLSVDEALVGVSTSIEQEAGESAVIDHFLESLGQDTLPADTAFGGQQGTTNQHLSPYGVSHDNRSHGSDRRPHGTFQGSSRSRLGPDWKSNAPSGSPGFPGSGVFVPSGDDDAPLRRHPSGHKRKRPVKSNRRKYPCVFYGSTDLDHEITRECGGRQLYVSQLRRHHDRHGFCYCKKCSRRFPNPKARDEHFANEPCVPVCMNEGCPNYGKIAARRQHACTHPNTVTQRDLWRYLFQLARPRVARELVPDPERQILGTHDTTTVEVDEAEPQQLLPQFMPPSAVLTTTSAMAQPSARPVQNFDFDWDAFGMHQPVDNGGNGLESVLLHSRQLSALAEEMQTLSGALDPAASRSARHVMEDMQHLERRMTALRGELRQNMARQRAVDMLRNFNAGGGTSFGL